MRKTQTIKIRVKPHLKYFIIGVYNQEPPIRLPIRDKLGYLLEILLAKRPKKPISSSDKESFIEFIIPNSDYPHHELYNYLSLSHEKRISKRIEMLFWVTYEEFIHECFKHDMAKNDSVMLFLEKYGIPFNVTLFNRLRKELYRSKVITRRHPPRKNLSKKANSEYQVT